MLGVDSGMSPTRMEAYRPMLLVEGAQRTEFMVNCKARGFLE